MIGGHPGESLFLNQRKGDSPFCFFRRHTVPINYRNERGTNDMSKKRVKPDPMNAIIKRLESVPAAEFGTILRVGIQDAQIKEDLRDRRYWRLDANGSLIRGV